MSLHRIQFGTLDLCDGGDDGDGYTFNVLADGASFGAADPVTSVVMSLMSDGDHVRYDRAGNRELSFRVQISGSDATALALGEAALASETKRGNTLTWTPPDEYAAPTVFDVVTSWIDFEFDDQAELRSERVYRLTLVCLPFARSVDKTTVPALSAGLTPATASVYVGSSGSAGWSGAAFYNPNSEISATLAPAPGGGVVIAYGPGVVGDPVATAGLVLKWNTPVSFSTGRYVVVEVAWSGVTPRKWLGAAKGPTGGLGNMTLLAVDAIDATKARLTFLAPSSLSSATGLNFYMTTSAGVRSYMAFVIHKVDVTNMPPGTSGRQLTRVVQVSGTERSPASLHAFTPSGFLGRTIVHTIPLDAAAGYTPDMRRWRATGNTPVANGDARKISGLWEPLKPNPVMARRPARTVPRGGYVLMAALKADTVGAHQIKWDVKSVVSGVTIGETGGYKTWNFTAANTLTLVPLREDLTLPVVRSTNGLDVEVHLFNPSPTVAIHVEEWWLFKVDEDCALSIVNTSEGNLWLDSADMDNPVPTVWVGPEDKSRAFHPGAAGLIAQGTHMFPPGEVQVTTVSDSNDYLQAELSYYRRWSSHAPE